MTENSSFDDYIVDLHDNLDRLQDISDVDQQSAAIVADLAQAYSEHPSAMQTGRISPRNYSLSSQVLISIASDVSICVILGSKKSSHLSTTCKFKN